MRRPGFEKLRIWQEAHALMLKVHQIANKLPRKESKRTFQIKNSSSSVPDNSAEGHTSYYYNDKLKGMNTARKEAGETQNHLRAISDQSYEQDSLVDKLIDRYEGLIIGINNFVKYIIKKRDQTKTGGRKC